MFQLPIPESDLPDGVTVEKPLRLEGIKKEDFRCLLKILYPKCVLLPLHEGYLP
jgi:hypothetical protein